MRARAIRQCAERSTGPATSAAGSLDGHERASPTSRRSTASRPGWSERWEADGTYRFDRTADARPRCSRSTPAADGVGLDPHGHVFGYTQTDAIARFQRMRGKAVFFPIGWDDNGLATERRVQNFYGVRCDPIAAVRPRLPAAVPRRHAEGPPARSRSRGPTSSSCASELTATDEPRSRPCSAASACPSTGRCMYTTIDDVSRRTSASWRSCATSPAARPTAPRRPTRVGRRRPHRRRPGRDRGPRACPAPTTSSRSTAPDGDVADRHDAARAASSAACALVAHPDDERYQPLFGTTVRTPLFDVEVPVVAHPLAEPDKGTGIAMICTFGDTTDVTWWRELDLPTRSVIGRDGRIVAADAGVARRPTPPRPPTREIAGADRQAGPERRSSSCCASRASCSASRGRSPTR